MTLMGRTGTLLLEPSGMAIDLSPDDEIVIETTASESPDFDVETLTHYIGEGAEVRVLRNGREIYSTVGRPVPPLPPGMGTRELLKLLGFNRSSPR